jgi:hypothetical protein
MSAEVKKEIQLEIAHVLFIDIVGYSKLSINEQRAAVDELTQIVRATDQFQKAEASDRLIKIATGDGMALVFYTSPEAPVSLRGGTEPRGQRLPALARTHGDSQWAGQRSSRCYRSHKSHRRRFKSGATCDGLR